MQLKVARLHSASFRSEISRFRDFNEIIVRLLFRFISHDRVNVIKKSEIVNFHHDLRHNSTLAVEELVKGLFDRHEAEIGHFHRAPRNASDAEGHLSPVC